MIKEKLYSIMSDGKPGLFLLQLPTGIGKSYSSEEAIVKYFENTEHPKRVVFITTQKKNLPHKLENKCKKLGFVVGQDIISLDNNEDVLKKAFPDSSKIGDLNFNIYDIDNSFKTKNFYELKKLISSIKRAVQTGLSDCIEPIRKNVNTAMYAWFDEVNTIMRKDGIRYEERSYAVLTNPKYQWIADAFPFTHINKAKIVLMSVDKLLLGRQTLVDKTTYLSRDFMNKNTILFIDEFDATKSDIRSKLIEHKTFISDFLILFTQLRHAVDVELSSILQESASEASKNDPRSHFRWDYIKEEAKKIEALHHLNYHFRTDIEEQGEDDSNILFRDDHFQAIGKNKFRYEVDLKRNNVKITSYKSSSPNEERASISHMMADIYGFTKLFANFISEWAKVYRTKVNEEKKKNYKEKKIDENEMTEDNAISSIIDSLDITTGKQLITDLCKQHFNFSRFKDKNPEKAIQRYSYYTEGFEYYELLDADGHYEKTIINMSAILETPESIILTLAKRCTVIGMSATACIDSVTGNYSLRFLRENLGDHFHDILEEDPVLRTELQKELEFKYQPYKDINVQVVPLENDNWRKDIETLFEGSRLFEDCEDLLMGSCPPGIKENYKNFLCNRYVGILKALMAFGKARDVKSMLSLNMILAKEDGDFRKNVITELASLVNQYCKLSGDDAIEVRFLASGLSFEVDKDAILKDLEFGKKIVIQSTYQTLGAGQNLQYKSNSDKLIKLNQRPDNTRAYDEKDLDWIYLGDITNLCGKKDENGNISIEQNIIMAEELCQNDEISKNTANRIVKAAFKGGKEFPKDLFDILSKTKSIKAERTIMVLQAIGRIVRTNQKISDIRILIDTNVLSQLDKKALESSTLVTKEVEALKQAYLDQYNEPRVPEDVKTIVYQAQNISCDFSRKMSSAFAREWGLWPEQWLKFWKELRKCVLSYPTASEDDALTHPIIKNFYISGFNDIDNYKYSYPIDDQKWFFNVNIKFQDTFNYYLDRNDVIPNEHEVSETNSRLQKILEFEGLKDYFEQNGFATSWAPNKYILSPVLFNNFYKGALGEIAGKFIFEKMTGFELEDISDPSKYEYFDFKVKGLDDVYVDFKHWCFFTCKPARGEKERVRDKMDKIDAKHCFYIGLLHPETDNNYNPKISSDKKITTIPYLLDENLKPDSEAFNKLNEVLNSLNTSL